MAAPFRAAGRPASGRSPRRAALRIVLRIGSFRIDTPDGWALACLLLFVVFVPLYLAARNTSYTGRT